jgi:hypothetical protein
MLTGWSSFAAKGFWALSYNIYECVCVILNVAMVW